MILTRALRLGPLSRVAIVGGGGKTTTLFALACDASSPVIIATTAHMAIDQTTLADRHVVLDDSTLLAMELPAGVTFFTGPADQAGKTTGLTPAAMSRVLALVDQQHVPLFIEADGSKCRPLKTLAEYEPPIPDFVDTVICVVGLLGLGQALTADVVHRPERFANLSGLAIGESITPEAVARVLCAPLGGLKNIPARARRIVLLNQSDTPELQAQAQIIARQVLPTFGAAVISALKLGQIFAVHEAVGGVILAARRSGAWSGEPD